MKNKKESITLPLRFELAYEIIYKSTCFIFLGLTFLFASNLLRFNWFSVFFGLLTLILIYLRRSSYLIIEDDQLKLIYFKFFKSAKIELEDVKKCFFYEDRPLIEIKTKEHEHLKIYLKEKNKEKLLNWLVTHYPEISSLYIKST